MAIVSCSKKPARAIGLPIHCVLAPACPDVTLVPEVVENYRAIVVGGDKGYVSQPLQVQLRTTQNLRLLARKRKNQKEPNTAAELYFLGHFRKLIETVQDLI